MGTLKKKIAGFVSVAMDTLMTPEMKICIADAFARDGRLTIIRIEECQTLAATRGPNIEGLSVIDSIEPEIPDLWRLGHSREKGRNFSHQISEITKFKPILGY